MSDVFSLEGKNAVVTGLSSGIGQSIAEALARQGAKVAGDYGNNAEGAAETARLIEAHGREAMILQGDTGNEAHVQALADDTVESCPLLYIARAALTDTTLLSSLGLDSRSHALRSHRMPPTTKE